MMTSTDGSRAAQEILTEPGKESGGRITHRESAIIFLLGLIVYAALGIYLQRLDIFVGDAVSRTAAASSVLYSRDPHLAALGFVWNPLPSFLQVPIVFLLHSFHLDTLIAANLLSAMLGAATLVVLNKMMWGTAMSTDLRWILLGLYALNPMILLYSANGMSESLFIFLLILAVMAFMRWSEDASLGAFALVIVLLMLALQTRYEALAFAVAVACSVVVVLTVRSRRDGIAGIINRMDGHLVAYGTGITYSFGAWVFFNWTIMDDPLYFLHSIYGNSTQTEPFRAEEATFLSSAVGSISESLIYGAELMVRLFPAVAVIALISLAIALKQRSAHLFCLLALTASIPLFQVFMIFSGQSFGWLRFFIYAIPFSYVLLIALWRATSDALQEQRGRILGYVLALLILVSNVFTWFAMDNPALGREEYFVTCKVMNREGISTAYSMGRFKLLNAYLEALPPGNVLVDSFLGYPYLLVATDPTRYVTTSDRDFEQAAANPEKYVSYVLVPRPEGLGESDYINRMYADLWDEADPAFELDQTFELHMPGLSWTWKLFRVVDAPAQPDDAESSEQLAEARVAWERYAALIKGLPDAGWC